MDKIFGLPVVIDSAVDMDKVYIGHKQQLPPVITGRKAIELGNLVHDDMLDAFANANANGTGLLNLDLSALEGVFSRGNSKSLMWGMQYFEDYMQHTVKHDLKMLQTAQTTNGPGTDPLFEAMEKHNQLMKMGRACMKEMFHARPLNLNQKTTGPLKAKDWE